MAETKVHKETEAFNLETKVVVTSIAGWETGFVRKADGYGDVTIAPHGSVRLSRNEILAQIQSGNKLFAGTDGVGSHATLYIDDKKTREQADFEDGSRKQKIFLDDTAKSLFAIKSFEEFKKAFDDAIVTRLEKYAVIEAVKKFGLNDFDKIRYIEQQTGYKMI